MSNQASYIDGDVFDPSLRRSAYQSDAEYLDDLFRLLSRLLSAALRMRDKAGESPENIALSCGVAPEPQAALLQAGRFTWSCRFTHPLYSDAREHIESRAEASIQGNIFLTLEWLRFRFKLDDFTFFSVLCAFASSVNRSFETLFVALHGEYSLRFATFGTAQALYELCAAPAPADMREMLDPHSLANRLLFCEQDKESIPDYLRPLELRPQIIRFLTDMDYRDPELIPWYRDIPQSRKPPQPLYREKQLTAAANAVRRMRESGPSILVLSGPEGCGRKLTVGTVSEQTGQPFLLLRPAATLENRKIEQLARYLSAVYLLEERIPVLELFDQPDQAVLRLLESMLQNQVPIILLTPPLRSSLVLNPYLVQHITYPNPNLEESGTFWKHFSSMFAGTDSVNWPEVAAKHVLTPGKIYLALRNAAECARSQEEELTARLLDRAVLEGNANRLSEVADRIEAFYTWEDLVLDNASKTMLRCICDRVRMRSLVENEWAFGKRFAYGKGISVLFYGPPGTGKSMCAQVIARELNLPLYRINLAQITSKYIGETAKNLDIVFKEAKNSNVILFFDEADALFSKRTDLKSSNDRHANSESAYLLQKVEEYDGISILATNLANNFDEAFRRRINYMVHIHMPSSKQRLDMWRMAFPPDAPLSDDVGWELLADNLEISGSVIKSAALQAAYFAAANAGEITMAHLVQAVRLELQKLGKSEPHFMNMYPAYKEDETDIL